MAGLSSLLTAGRDLEQPDAMSAQPPLQGGGAFDRDRDRDRERDRDMEEQRHRALQQEELARRERDRERDRERERERDRDRDDAERQHREPYQPTAPHHSSAGSIPIHQPVASRVANTIHSPGGLLANHGGSAPSLPMGAPSGPAPTFGGPLHSETGRPAQHNGPPGAASASQHQMFAPMPHGPGGSNNSLGGAGGPPALFGGPLQPENTRPMQQEGVRAMQQMPFGPAMGAGHPIPSGPGGMPQGQQPILNVRRDKGLNVFH